jgi:hypothetical protein
MFEPAGELVCLNCWAFDRDRWDDWPCKVCRRNPHHKDEYMSKWVHERQKPSERAG